MNTLKAERAMTTSDKLREIAEKYFPTEERLSNYSLYNQLQQSNRDNLLSDLTALISEHYTANEEVDKMVEEKLREELIAYVKWYGSFSYENLTDEMLVDEYLKSREK